MSRIGLEVIEVPEKVTVTKNSDDIIVKGPRGELTRYSDPCTTLEQKDGEIHFSRSGEADRAPYGTEGANLVFMIEDVTDGYVKKLTLVGVEYRVVARGKKLTLSVGYSHPVVFEVPEGVTAKTPSAASIGIEDISKQVAGQSTAEIRDVRPSESYEGKGICYEDEYVCRKEGKTGK